MTRQWIRYCRLTIEGSGKTLDVSQLRIAFRVGQGDRQTPNHADIRIYNLSAETQELIKKEFDKVSLEAGYEDGHGVVFKGEIIQKRTGRENPVDTYLDIVAKTSVQAYDYAVTSKTLGAGWTHRDVVDQAAADLKPYGVTVGHVADLGSFRAPRATTLFGMTRDVLRRVGFATDTSWSIQNGELQLVKNRGTLPGDAFVLNSRTGMVGLPIQSLQGVEVRCLLNPKIRPGSRVKIDQASIQEQRFAPQYTAEVNNSMIPSLAPDGFYKVLIVDHVGDTRGQPWYSDLVCLRADGQGPFPLSLGGRGITIPD
ncbi:phage protein [Salinarimonas soli]|uniref:Bacteriophage protein n=1 Tax=Salinarimonas soli TaxID=1638099 RepID=A0A5B2VFM6_9HYPH|nr:hypothetical protein [Salinarimonas soli]KAA2237665.1 hypothetical protein F0L46_08265 [Salinarimonas soli]